MSEWRKERDRMLASDPELVQEYEKLAPRFAVIRQLIDMRAREEISQSELARRMDVHANVTNHNAGPGGHRPW